MVRRALWMGFGCLCVALAAAGAVLPLLPTTPFLLLAAYAFARSSKRLHDWLLAHRQFGPLIRNWQRHGAIDRRAKWLAVLVMMAALTLSLVLRLDLRLVLVQGVVMLAAASFILTRPDGPAGPPS